jgi:Zn-dependent protease with chaperone function
VLVALVTIGTGWPAKLLPANPSTPYLVQLAHVAGVLGVHLVLFLGLDLVGGVTVVRRKPSLGLWLWQWLRGAGMMLLVAIGVSAALLAAGRRGGTPAALVTAVALGVLLLLLNDRLARVVAAFRFEPVSEPVRRAALRAGIDVTQLRVVASEEEAFTGGWVGLAGRTLWLPLQWVNGLTDDELAAQLSRRAAMRGVRWRGIFAALLWNTFGFAMALQAPDAGADTAAGLIATSAWFTLWQFAGLLLLPSVSRPAILEADDVAAVRVGADATYRAMAKLDEWQEGESSRPEAIETIFHPVPQLRERIQRLQAGASAEALPPSFYHATRTMLASGWAFTGLLGRAVHCNLGRPALWVVFPSD